MAITASSSSSLQFSNPFPSSLSTTPFQLRSKPLFSFSTKAQDPETETNPSPDTTETPPPPPTTTTDTDSFENRLAQVRLRYRSGQGKKAEQRKGKKPKKSSSSSSGGGGGGGVFLPPVPLKEPISGGLKVEFGFSPYTERLNGRLAILGLVAVLLVELGSGKSLISYHTPTVVFLQIYFVAAVSAIFVKYEKERFSFWPQSPVKKVD